MRKIILITAALYLGNTNEILGQNVPASSSAIPGTASLITLPGAILNAGNSNLPYTNVNYTRVWVPRVPVQDGSGFSLNAAYDITVNTTYVNGWGNPILSISRGLNANKKDIVMPFDNRPSLQSAAFLPYADSLKSKFQINPYLEQKNYHLGLYPVESGASYGLSKLSSANNVTTSYTYTAGKSFAGQDRGVKTYTLFNTYTDDVKMLGVNNVGLLEMTGVYGANELTVKITEGHNQTNTAKTYEFYDRTGLLICKKVAISGGYLVTYYVYDDMGRVLYILTPKAVTGLAGISWVFSGTQGQNILNKLCHSYKYNSYGQIIEKRNPDRDGSEYTVYDKKQRPVLFQTPLLAQTNKWMFTIYDSRGRTIMTGLCSSAGVTGTPGLHYTRQDWQNAIDNATAVSVPATLLEFLASGFRNAYPAVITGCDIHTYNYYDAYGAYAYTNPVPTQPVKNFDYTFSSDYLSNTESITPQPYTDALGQLTASKVKVLDDNNIGGFTNQWISTVYWYDQKGRLIQTATQHPWNSTSWDVNTIQYNFSGQPIININQHYGGPGTNMPSLRIVTRYTYTDGLVRYADQSLNGSAFRNLAAYEYDELNRVKLKTHDGIADENYSYNIRGQLTGINADHLTNSTAYIPSAIRFMETLSYDAGFTAPRYDGSISGFKWKTKSFPAGGYAQAAYGYNYDPAGRLTGAGYRDKIGNPATASWINTTHDYTVSNVDYDENGNMKTMNQRGVGPSNTPATIDQLSYNYDGNRLQSVTDAGVNAPSVDDFNDGNGGTDYSYDADGNLASDLNKGIASITYNHQDLPLQVSAAIGWVKNVYDASGNLLKKVVFSTAGTGTTTEYRYWGPFVYKNDFSNPTTPWSLDYLLHEEGRCRWLPGDATFKYDYFIKDHLGNVRTTVTADEYNTLNDYLATHEVASAQMEGLLFTHLDDVRDDSPEGTPMDLESARLNGAESGRRIGTALVVRVMEGDKIKLSTRSWYDENGNSNIHAAAADMMASILGALTGGGGGGGGEGGGSQIVGQLFNSVNYIQTYDALKEDQTNPDLPRAYLNYIVFDEGMRIVPEESGVLQVGAEPGQWNSLDLPEFKVVQNGYVALYISNEQHMNVFFDDVRLLHYKGRLLEEQHYYPHGLLISKWASNTQPVNKFQYQGEKMQDEIGLNLYDFHARQYDPQIGRFWGVDPMDQFPSSYTGMGNDPANMIDPSGMLAKGAFNSEREPDIGSGAGGLVNGWRPPENADLNMSRWEDYLTGSELDRLEGVCAAGKGVVPIGIYGPMNPTLQKDINFSGTEKSAGFYRNYNTIDRSAAGLYHGAKERTNKVAYYGEVIAHSVWIEFGGEKWYKWADEMRAIEFRERHIRRLGMGPMAVGTSPISLAGLLRSIRSLWGGANAAKTGGSLVNLTEETFSRALFTGAENVGGYSVYGTKGLVGSTFNRNIFLLEASGGKSLSGFRSLVGSLEAEALGAGANKISIYGSSVINKGFLNPNIARRFGYSFEQSGSGVFLQKVLK